MSKHHWRSCNFFPSCGTNYMGNISLPLRLLEEMSWYKYQEAEKILIDNVQYIKANIWREISCPLKGIPLVQESSSCDLPACVRTCGIFFGARLITLFCNQFKILLTAFVNPVTIAYQLMHFATFYLLNVGKKLWTLCLTRSKNLAVAKFYYPPLLLQMFYS